MEMAYGSTLWNDIIGLCRRLFNLPNFSIMEWFQTLLVFLASASALLFLGYKWLPIKNKKSNSSCGKDCGCH